MKWTLLLSTVVIALLGVLAFGQDAETKDGTKGKWDEHTGNLPFVIGYEKGMTEVKLTGKPPMYFFTTTW